MDCSFSSLQPASILEMGKPGIESCALTALSPCVDNVTCFEGIKKLERKDDMHFSGTRLRVHLGYF